MMMEEEIIDMMSNNNNNTNGHDEDDEIISSYFHDAEINTNNKTMTQEAVETTKEVVAPAAVPFDNPITSEAVEITKEVVAAAAVPLDNTTTSEASQCSEHYSKDDDISETKRIVNSDEAVSKDDDHHQDEKKTHNSDLMAVLNIRAYGEDHILPDEDENNMDHRGWEDIAFDGSEGKDKDGKEEEGEDNKNLLKAVVARWWKTGPKSPSEQTLQNQPKPSQPLVPTKDATNIKISALGSTEQEAKTICNDQDKRADPDRTSARSRVPRWWWRGTGTEDTTLPPPPPEEDASHTDAEVTNPTLDGGSMDDYDETDGAELMSSALDWLCTTDKLQNQQQHQVDDDVHVELVGSDLESLGNYDDDIDDENDDSVTGGTAVPRKPSASRTPEQRSADLEKVVQWMRKGKAKGRKREDKYDPTGEFRKLEGMLPKRKGITPEERAIEIEGALDWLRKYYAEESLPATAAAKVGEEESDNANATNNEMDWSHLSPAPVCLTSPDDRLCELENIMMWIRNKGQGMGSKYDPNGTFRQLNKCLPRRRRSRKGQTPEDRGREMEGVLDWMRNSGLIPLPKATSINNNHIVLPENIVHDNMKNVHVSRRSPEKRAKDLKDVLMWMSRGNTTGADADESMDPLGHFRRLNMILEVKEGQSSEDRAREIECSLDWLLHNDSDGSLTSSPGGRHRNSSRGGGRRRKRRTPSPGKQHRRKSPEARGVPKLIAKPREVQPNLFASIGRVVHVVAPAPPPPSGDVSTTGITTITDENDVLIDMAQQHTIEMANAIAFLVEPSESPAREDEIHKVDSEIFGNSNGNWWESGDSVNATEA